MARAEDELLARATARVGRVLSGKYRLERVLGIGGMATVYAALHRNGRRVALKMLHAELSVNAEARARFLREGQAANAVNHPGAVVVIDDDVAEDGSAFIVMELLEGQVIEALWAENDRRLPPRTVLAIARELCEVLEAAHRGGIVHRDIKPENLFLTHDGRLKVLDFGLARVRDALAPKMTHTGMVFGTPAFMAPEQASGRVSKIDAKTDVWAVGATMFTLLSGALVHEGETAQHVVVLAATKRARSLASVLPDAEAPLVFLVDRALALEKKARWQSAEAMRQAICEASMTLFGNPRLELSALSDLTRVQRQPSPIQPPKRSPRLDQSSDTHDYFPPQAESADTQDELPGRAFSPSDTQKDAFLADQTVRDVKPRAIESSDGEDALTRVRGSAPEWVLPVPAPPGAAFPLEALRTSKNVHAGLPAASPRATRRRLIESPNVAPGRGPERRARRLRDRSGVVSVLLGFGDAAASILARGTRVLGWGVAPRALETRPRLPSGVVRRPVLLLAGAGALFAISLIATTCLITSNRQAHSQASDSVAPQVVGEAAGPPTIAARAPAPTLSASPVQTASQPALAADPTSDNVEVAEPSHSAQAVPTPVVPSNPYLTRDGGSGGTSTIPFASAVAPASSASAGSSRGAACTPPYTVNADGKVLWKAECLKPTKPPTPEDRWMNQRR